MALLHLLQAHGLCYPFPMPKRPKTPEPVTESEVSEAVKAAILNAFPGRHLDIEVARRGLSHAAFDLMEMHLREVAERAKK